LPELAGFRARSAERGAERRVGTNDEELMQLSFIATANYSGSGRRTLTAGYTKLDENDHGEG
jgi:hypothetical protein